MKLEELISASSLEKLNKIKADEEERYKEDRERLVKDNIERLRPYRFTSRQEVIDYVKAGNKLYEENDNGYMYYIPETNEVAHYSMEYDRICDMPIGMSTFYMSWDNFVKWTAWMDDENNKQQGTIPYWRKKIDE